MVRPKKKSREPLWRTSRDRWYLHHGRKTLRLSPDKDEASRLWHEQMAKPPGRNASTRSGYSGDRNPRSFSRPLPQKHRKPHA
jgi:hypothetical protein